MIYNNALKTLETGPRTVILNLDIINKNYVVHTHVSCTQGPIRVTFFHFDPWNLNLSPSPSAGLGQVCSAACGDFLHHSRSQVSLRPLWLEDVAQLAKTILSCCFAARKKKTQTKTYDFRLKELTLSQENKPGNTIILLHFINHSVI